MLLAALCAVALSGQTLTSHRAVADPASALPQDIQFVALSDELQPSSDAHEVPPADHANDVQSPSQVNEAQAKKPPTPERTGVKALFANLAGDYTHLPHRDNFYVAV